MIEPVMAISNLVLTQQTYSEETNGAHAHYREPVPLTSFSGNKRTNFCDEKSTMMLSGESIFREQARKLGIEV